MSGTVITNTPWYKWFEANSKDGHPPDPAKLIAHYTKNKLTPPSSEEMDRIYFQLYGVKSSAQIKLEETQKKEHAQRVTAAKAVKELKKAEKEKDEGTARANIPVTVTIEGIDVSNDEPEQPPATTAVSATAEAADLLAEIDAIYHLRKRSCSVFKKD